MGRQLGTTVHILDPDDGQYHVYGPGDDVPKKHAAQLADDWPGWADGDESGVPPKAGAGSGKGAWHEYAAANNVEVDEDASRDDVIAALDAAGVPTE